MSSKPKNPTAGPSAPPNSQGKAVIVGTKNVPTPGKIKVIEYTISDAARDALRLNIRELGAAR